MRQKAFNFTLSSKAVCMEPPYKCEAYSIHGWIRPLHTVTSWWGEKNWRRQLRTPNFIDLFSLGMKYEGSSLD